MSSRAAAAGARAAAGSSNRAVALKVVGAAAVTMGAWCSWGYWVHNQVMEHANEVERQIAHEVGWDNTKQPLYAFDPEHPNNTKWAAAQQAQRAASRSAGEVPGSVAPVVIAAAAPTGAKAE